MDSSGNAVEVGVRVPRALFAEGVDRVAGFTAAVEAAGLDRLWVGDHVSFKGGQGYDGLLQATALATLTRRVAVQTAVYLLPLSINHWLVRVTATEAEAGAFLDRVAAKSGVTPDLLHRSPAVLVGTVDRLADVLVERRERFGFSHLQLDAGFPPADLPSLYPLVSRLAGG